MLNWLRRLLQVPIPTYYDGEGKERPIQEAIQKLFAERDELGVQRVMLCDVIRKLPHEGFCNQFNKDYLDICSCAKRILKRPDYQQTSRDLETIAAMQAAGEWEGI